MEDFSRLYTLDELASAPTVFSATGVTDGALLDGVKTVDGRVHTETLVMDAGDFAVRRLRTSRPAP